MKNIASKILNVVAVLLMVVGTILFIFTDKTGLACGLSIYGLFIGPIAATATKIFAWFVRRYSSTNQQFRQNLKKYINPEDILHPENKDKANQILLTLDRAITIMGSTNIYAYCAIVGLPFLMFWGLSANVAFFFYNGIATTIAKVFTNPILTGFEIFLTIVAVVGMIYIPWLVPRKETFSVKGLVIGISMLTSFGYDIAYFGYWSELLSFMLTRLMIVYILAAILLAEFCIYKWADKIVQEAALDDGSLPPAT